MTAHMQTISDSPWTEPNDALIVKFSLWTVFVERLNRAAQCPRHSRAPTPEILQRAGSEEKRDGTLHVRLQVSESRVRGATPGHHLALVVLRGHVVHVEVLHSLNADGQ